LDFAPYSSVVSFNSRLTERRQIPITGDSVFELPYSSGLAARMRLAAGTAAMRDAREQAQIVAGISSLSPVRVDRLDGRGLMGYSEYILDAGVRCATTA
jgi:hypothetical protein